MFSTDWKEEDQNHAFEAFMIDKLNEESGMPVNGTDTDGMVYDSPYDGIPDYSDSGEDY